MRAEYVFVVVGFLWCFAGPPAVQAAARTSTRTASLIEALNEAQGPPPSSSSQGVKQVQLASGTSHLSTATPSLFSSEKEQQQEQQQQPSSSSSGDSAGGSTDERVIHDIQHSTEAHNQRTFIGPGGAKVVVLSNANSMEDIEVATSVDPKVEKEEMRKSRIEELNKRRGEQFVKMRQEEIQKKQQEAKLELLEKEETHNKRLKMLQLKSKDREENMKLREQQRQNEEQFQKAQAKRTQEEQGKALAQRQEGHDKRVQQRAQEQRVKATSIRLVNYRAYGKGYAPVSLHKEGVVCLVSGVASGSNSLVGIMPPACRPTEGRLVLNVIKNNVDTQLDILPDGRMFALTQPGFGWLSLSGIAFSTQPVHPIQLLNSWTVYGKHYRAPTQAKQEDLCVLGGVLQRGKTNVIGRVDEWCWPRDGQLVFSVNHRDRVTRLDVTTAGYIVKNGGSDKYGWVSLDGLVYTQHAGETLALVNGWTHYNKGYRFGSFRKVGRVVYLSGVIQSGSWNHVISVLPAGYRPAHRQVFSVNVHGQGARVDVLPDGRLAYISGRPDKIWWLSLDGIHFVAAS